MADQQPTIRKGVNNGARTPLPTSAPSKPNNNRQTVAGPSGVSGTVSAVDDREDLSDDSERTDAEEAQVLFDAIVESDNDNDNAPVLTPEKLAEYKKIEPAVTKYLLKQQDGLETVDETVECDEAWITRPPPEYTDYSTQEEKDKGVKEDNSKNEPKKPKNHRAIDEDEVDENGKPIREMGKLGVARPDLCRISYFTEKETELGNNNWVPSGHEVVMVYSNTVYWRHKDSVKKLNAWRYQIYNRNFKNTRPTRDFWTVAEMEFVKEQLNEQINVEKRRTPAFKNIANRLNERFFFAGVIQPVGEPLLKPGQQKTGALKKERLAPWRSGQAIQTACFKNKGAGGAKDMLTLFSATVGVVDPDAAEDNGTENVVEPQEDVPEETLKENPNARVIAPWQRKIYREPKSEGASGSGSDETPSTNTKGKKAGGSKRKRNEAYDEEVEAESPAKKKPATKKVAVRKTAAIPDEIDSSSESESGIPAVAVKKPPVKKAAVQKVAAIPDQGNNNTDDDDDDDDVPLVSTGREANVATGKRKRDASDDEDSDNDGPAKKKAASPKSP